MKLYHGTDGRKLDHILRTGLKPRGRGKSNWDHNGIHSNARCVYFTDSYAPYFAVNAANGKNPSCAVIEVDTELLDVDELFPDEDFLEQASRKVRNPVEGTMKERTMHYRRHQFDYGPGWRCTAIDGETPCRWWEASLHYLGTCAHRGVVPPSAITAAIRWPVKGNGNVMLVFDPTITIVNQQILGDRYRALIRKLMTGEFTTVDEMRERHAKRHTLTAQQDFDENNLNPPMPVVWGWERIEPSRPAELTRAELAAVG